MRSYVILLTGFTLLFMFTSLLYAEDHIDLVKQGNQAFLENDFKTALEYYRSAETEIPESPELNYNIAGALHNEEKYEEAVELYNKSINTTDINMEARSHYNLGNTYFRMGDFQNAIKSAAKILKVDYRKNLKIPDAHIEINLDNRNQIIREIRKQRPLLLLAPYQDDRHPDHVHTSR